MKYIVISYGSKGRIKTAQVIGNSGKKYRTFHLWLVGSMWLDFAGVHHKDFNP